MYDWPEKVIDAAGISTDGLDHIKHYNQNETLDVVQLDYSILNRSPKKEVLPYLQEQEIGVVMRG